MKDKTYYLVVDGKTVRVRATKKPDKKLTEALTAMVKCVYNNKSKYVERTS